MSTQKLSGSLKYETTFVISNVTNLRDLLDMMRYDKMTFYRQVDVFQAMRLAPRSCGSIAYSVPDSVQITLTRIHEFKKWIPEFQRWNSFNMTVQRLEAITSGA